MSLVDNIQRALTDTGTIKRSQLLEAMEYSRQNQVSYDKALMALNLAGLPLLGRCYSDTFAMPYVPLVQKEPPLHALHVLPLNCFVKWKAVPVDFDAQQNLLTVAVSGPEQARKIDRIYRFLLHPHVLGFTVASEAEIEAAIQKYLTKPATPAPPRAAAGSGQTKTEVTSRLKAALSQRRVGELPHPPSAGSQKSSAAMAEMGRKHFAGFTGEVPYAEMSRAFLSMTALVAKLQIGNDAHQLQAADERVRYCQLLAARLALAPTQADGLLAAAWLTVVASRHELIHQLESPYPLTQILGLVETPESKTLVEQQILSLVLSFQALREKEPQSSRDVNLARRYLRANWSSAPERQDLLEVFLQLLMDEAFLSDLHQSTGAILIVDPEEASRAGVGPMLRRDGYQVKSTRDSASAEAIMAETLPDLLLVAYKLADGMGVKWCQKLRSHPATARLPILMMIDEEKEAAECLRAGANDCVSRPVNLEVLFLKLQRALAATEGEKPEQGVKGSLADMSFTDMIQILSAGAKNMEITLVRGDREGKVYIRSGQIIHAAVGKLKAEAAFYEMMRWHEGEFSTRQCGEFPEPSIESSTMSLLMEGARLVDEAPVG
jgi:CheY-like chemotaxis protein